MCISPECTCIKYVAGDHEEQKRGLDSLELELWLVGSTLVLEIKLMSSVRTTSVPNH